MPPDQFPVTSTGRMADEKIIPVRLAISISDNLMVLD
jgi:hypothetical protein